MNAARRARTRVGILVVAALVGVLTTAPAFAAATPVDVSGPVDGLGPGIALAPSSSVVAGMTLTITAENLPSAAEAAAWIDDGDFSDETGTYTGALTIALCGNADSGGVPLGAAFDPALHCDGGDARSATFVVSANATAGALSTPVVTRDGLGQFDFDNDGDPLTPTVLASDGIGSALATCVPSADPCRYLVQDGLSFSGLASFNVVPAPTLTITSITGQAVGALAARAGNDLVVSGTGWGPASGLAVALCDGADELVCDASSSTAGLTVDAGGVMSGTVPVTALNTTGLRSLKITQTSNGVRALAPIQVLGTRSITIDPTSGGASTAVNITGTDFDPLQAVTVTGSDGVNPTSDVGVGVVDASGALTGSILVLSPATVSIVVTEDDAPTSEGASAGFGFTIESQVGQLTVDGSALTLTQTGGLISMSPVTLADGLVQQSTGMIQTVSLTDSRGTLSGWAVTATATDWTDIAEPDPLNPSANRVIPAGNLAWLPSCAPATGSTANPADVVAGPPATLDPTVAATLCSAAPGGGGGGWVADAALLLNVPSSIAAGTYQATLTIVAV